MKLLVVVLLALSLLAAALCTPSSDEDKPKNAGDNPGFTSKKTGWTHMFHGESLKGGESWSKGKQDKGGSGRQGQPSTGQGLGTSKGSDKGKGKGK
ncbi:Brorin [Frankliniella fusca]|uniref:Brorin n=1 Tax=Frankliniella fusca TaxID=407009 RepID=A0AAE1I0N1_9NEOP|nr:Brorin [Frankliniella fusca]